MPKCIKFSLDIYYLNMNQITVKYKVQNTYSQSTTNFVLVYQKLDLSSLVQLIYSNNGSLYQLRSFSYW